MCVEQIVCEKEVCEQWRSLILFIIIIIIIPPRPPHTHTHLEHFTIPVLICFFQLGKRYFS